MYFLLVFSFDEGRLIHQMDYVNSDEAIAAYNAAEKQYRPHLDRFEIVLIGADSIATVMKTHGHYFNPSESSIFSEFLRDPQTV
ncbi:hypothetical protein A5700_22500 [Mycobacterium sp. E1214]|nr:hypothetical protein A5700_22500 [Mycobacterium sp. E1214]OBH23783.1 hypothetical protein A5693_09570 [Mycobacterium sp. E1319]